ncbi:hypothetical protein BU24DRAFT_87984 [Aaosphaeria arxii CBS 175.79]|uniref:MARVEL domain-containing protein n=1 Tax=Aaosphaeria arxii CBS 175.79 TaxID=1450172 RepID=A0A6A5X7J4_9PLEO|nr:uncharacterized protein BU24DRAFT_87984 [Aaosphaeria arxii CBS 175.79]KAF2008902.1 hypothetical protein BU24DRAFT_87984 [Aaosphaeria arxii CBS 175.79]
MQINPAPLHMAQAIIMGLSAAMSVAILGTAAHTLDVFNKQQSSNPWWLPLWPQHFDVNGAKALVGSAVTTLVLCSAFLVVALVPYFNLANKHTLRALLALGTTLPSTLVTLVTVIYAHILNHNAPELDSIQTWTCKYKNSQPIEEDISLPKGMGNGNFGSLCRESKFALYGTLVVFLLLSASMGLAIVTWLADKWAARKTRKEMDANGNAISMS